MEANNILITKIEKSKIGELDFDNLSFGRDFSDHAFLCRYKDGKWGQPIIEPYGKLQFAPSTAVLHYGQAIFEGMKAQKNKDGDAFIFIPEMNVQRMNKSAVRMGMPEIPVEIFISGLKQLLDIDMDLIPEKDRSSLYIRPFMFGTD